MTTAVPTLEDIMANFNPKDPDFKTAFKEGLDEWLDKKFTLLGKWTLGGLMAAALAGAVYLSLFGLGWLH